jgi:multiple sugar transport system ATP-binding protein
MGFALEIAGVSKSEIEARVQEAAKILALEPFLDRKPKAMSGGQRQRVAMGRAIVRKPQVFLMDEPLSNLDAKLRVQTRTQIAKLQRDLAVTTVYVTHDQTEAMTMGDRIAVLKDGLLMQVGTPQELYDTPSNVFVAGFIGSPAMNIFEAPIEAGKIRLGDVSVDLPPAAAAELTSRGRSSVIFGVRPEDLRITGSESAWPVEVQLVEGLGADAYVYTEVQVPGGASHEVVIRTDGRQHPATGTILRLEAIPHHVHLFDPQDGERLHYQ